ncbi:hypothetical protein L1987_29536 [Smallanthus sonchifolius]|uniref:Uncharacterized protein n=1 Tax=Smallanthus sonchifolius TaxID=185202 RepID=A0ACB9I1U2_9ASTR|nr:hypothetical protein L1987_29536 [Smallanthus sonchifolius]
MLDLNLTFVHDDMRTAVRGELEESGTSNSSLVNAEGCSSSNVGDDGDNFHCFDFDILKVGDTVGMSSNSNDEDRTSQSQAPTRSEWTEFVTRTTQTTRSLFPTRHEEGRLNPEHQVNSLLLFPNSNESEEMRLVHVQQNKLTVQQNQIGKKSRRGPRSRSSQYRGVTFYRRTGRWESHIWDCGKQVYLGGFDTAHAAARAYDRAAIKFRGVDADINFNISDYEEDMNQIKSLSKEDFVHLLRRHSGGFSRGGSKYRGVVMNNCGMWEARTGQVLGKMSLQAGNAGLPIISEHGQSWTGAYPRIIGGSSSQAWQPHGQSQTPTALFTAASSGFPAPAPSQVEGSLERDLPRQRS